MRMTLLSLVIAAGLLVGCTSDAGLPATSGNPVDTPTAGEEGQPFRLLIHCGLSVPLEFGNRFWLPVDTRLRMTHNPPDGFGSDDNYDMGTIRRVDEDTIIYTSSEGVEVEYEPTKRRRNLCR